MTLGVAITTPSAIDERRTPIAGTYSSLTDTLFVWAKLDSAPSWPVVRFENEFAPRYREQSTADTSAAGEFSIMPLGGWHTTSVALTLEDVRAPGLGEFTWSADPGTSVERFEPIDVNLVLSPYDTLIVARIGRLPWEWHLIYNGIDDEFAPLFAPTSERSGNNYTLLPNGGWWSEEIELEPRVVI